MNTITFIVPGQPVAKARARVTKTGHAYTPKKTVDYERAVGMACKLAMARDGAEMLTGPVMLYVCAMMEIPRSYSIKRRAAMQGRPHVFRPDSGNILKAVEDSLNGIAYKDDSQIAETRIRKVYGLDPCISVRVEELS